MKIRTLCLILATASALLRSQASIIEVQNNTDSDAGSLRNAIANAAAGDTISFHPDLAGKSITLTSGELLIDKSLVILGPGPDKLAINGNAASRVFHVNSNIVVSISGLTIHNGLLIYWEEGGGIYNDHSTLTVSNCTISGNSTQYGGGGGIYNDGRDFGSATLRLSNCTVSGNSSTEDGGGGIFSAGSATLTVSNCTVVGNSADYGGGIESWGSDSSATVTIIASAINNNIAGEGGGVFNDDNSLLMVISSSIRSNSSTSLDGGGIFNDNGTTILTLSTVRDNSAGKNGGGLYNYRGKVTVRQCTVAGNSAADSGGGICNNPAYRLTTGLSTGTVEIVSSTLSGNSAVNYGGAVFNRGINGHAELTLIASTLSSNSAGVAGGSIFNNNGDGTTGSATLAIGNTILKPWTPGKNLGNNAGTLTSLGFNLSSDNASTFLNQPTDKSAVDPKLGPLQDNGGPTATHALLCGSPALDAGKNFTDSGTDQRGRARTIDDPNNPPDNANLGDGTDIGAFELGTSQYGQDFSSATVGATSFGDGSSLFSTDLGTVGSIQDGTLKELQLTVNGWNNTRSAFRLPDLDPGQAIYAFSAKWNSQLNGNFPYAGHGFSFNFGQLAGVDLISTAFAQEAGYTNGLAFSVLTGPGGNPGFYYRVAGMTFGALPFNPATQWGVNNNTRHFFEVDWNYFKGLTVRVDHQTVFSNAPTYGFVPRAGDRFVWAARTGNFAEEVRLDNIVVVTGGNLERVPISTPYHTSAGSLEPQSTFDSILPNGDCCFWADYSPPTGQIGGTLASRRNLNVYAITSGGPDRTTDPSQWILEGSTNAGASWSASGAANGHFLNPAETRCWLTTNAESFNAVRLNITTNNGSAAVIRVGELTAYKVAPVLSPWKQTSLTPGAYVVACSADGSRLAAAGFSNTGVSNLVYTSSDSGANWTASGAPSNRWFAICSSVDGHKLAAVNYPGYIFTLVDGVSSAPLYKGGYWRDIACSSDGNTLVAAGYDLGTSTNGGATWYQRTVDLRGFNGVAVSADGKKMAAARNDFAAGKMWTSTNSGVTWQETASPTKRFKSVASSSDGTKLYASTFNDMVYASTNSGGTWTATSLTNDYYWVACSADGNIVVAAGDSAIFVSFDSGLRWWNLGAPGGAWRSVAISADGAQLVASMSSGGVWTYDLLKLPSIRDVAPSQITPFSAMLNAQVKTYGMRTTVFFAYGTTTNYVNTLNVDASMGEGYVPVQMPLTGLAPATTYHVRARAWNANGIFRWGADQTFTTPGLPPTLLYGPVLTNGGFFARFSGVPNSTYTIEATTSLRPINWQKLTNVTTTGSGIISLQLEATNPPARYFRTVQPAY